MQKQEFQSFVDQLPEPFIILGDFNAHSPLSGDSRSDAQSRLIENFIFSTDACILNKKERTFFILANKAYSCIDLSIVSSILLPDFNWYRNKTPIGVGGVITFPYY